MKEFIYDVDGTELRYRDYGDSVQIVLNGTTWHLAGKNLITHIRNILSLHLENYPEDNGTTEMGVV